MQSEAEHLRVTSTKSFLHQAKERLPYPLLRTLAERSLELSNL
jgi:hypothetical protein